MQLLKFTILLSDALSQLMIRLQMKVKTKVFKIMTLKPLPRLTTKLLIKWQVWNKDQIAWASLWEN